MPNVLCFSMRDSRQKPAFSPHLARKAMEYEQLAEAAIEALYSTLPNDPAKFPITIADGDQLLEIQWRPRPRAVVISRGKRRTG
jgi:hypothetical protein